MIVASGVGAQEDPREAGKWWGRAVSAGHRRAPYHLGELFFVHAGHDLEEGKVGRNARAALFWLALAEEVDADPAKREEASRMRSMLSPNVPAEAVGQADQDLADWRSSSAVYAAWVRGDPRRAR